jgi:GTPase
MTETSCGFVALIGAPNAGKSTLINALVGSKVSVVSRKAQTTRTTVRGIVIEGAAQIIFVDTPGLFAPKRRLDRAMAASAWGAAADADVLALLIDARQELGGSAKTERGAASSDAPGGGLPHALSEQSETIMRALSESKTRKVLVLNKIDLVDRPALLALAERLNAVLKFEETFMISAATGDGLDQLRGRLGRLMAPGPWLYPEDQITDAPIRALAAEITREKLFERLHDELPYQATVETDSWKELPDGSVRIEQTIFVSRDSHKKIVIGEGGRTIKSIGTAARKEIAEANDGPVHLFLFVKVRANWLDDPERYRAMGLEFPKT